MTCLKSLHKVLRVQVGYPKEREQGGEKAPWRQPHWKRAQANVKSVLVNLVHLLLQSKDESMLVFVLQSCRHYALYFLGFHKGVARKYLKVPFRSRAPRARAHLQALMAHFASEDGSVRLAAFLRIRQLAVLCMEEMKGERAPRACADSCHRRCAVRVHPPLRLHHLPQGVQGVQRASRGWVLCLPRAHPP